MEMRCRHVNHARNVWDRAVTLMPRVDQFWFKFIYMEEMLGNISGARAVFDRWCEWEPDDHAWTSYVRLEMRANQPERARKVFEQYVACHNLPRSWIKWAKFEEKQAMTVNAREVFEEALQARAHVVVAARQSVMRPSLGLYCSKLEWAGARRARSHRGAVHGLRRL